MMALAKDVPSDVDPGWMYLHWRKNAEWRDRLAKRATHKALDIPDDDMQINSSTRTGIGTAGALGIAAAAGLPATAAAAFLGYMLMREKPAADVKPPADSAYTVRFYDADGKPIDVPHISTRP